MTNRKPSQILSYLYLGGKADAKSKDVLDSLNIKYILNCTPPKSVDPESGCPNYFQKDKTYHYLRIPIFDNIGENLGVHLDSAFKFIEEGKHYGNVLVHCHKGVSRSASFVIGYLMRKSEFTFEEAMSFVQSIRPIVQPNEAFIRQLSTYHPSAEAHLDGDNNTVTSATARADVRSFEVALPSSSSDSTREESVNLIISSATGLQTNDAASETDDTHVNKRVKLV